jgi:hypothetical protein
MQRAEVSRFDALVLEGVAHTLLLAGLDRAADAIFSLIEVQPCGRPRGAPALTLVHSKL